MSEPKEVEKLEVATGQVEAPKESHKADHKPAVKKEEEAQASKVVEAKKEEEKVLDIHTSKLKAIFKRNK